MNISQSNAYRKCLSRPYFYNDLRAEERQQVLDQQFYISVSVTYLLGTRSTCPDTTTAFHALAYGRFSEIQSNFRRKKLIERMKGPTDSFRGPSIPGVSFSNGGNIRAPTEFRRES